MTRTKQLRSSICGIRCGRSGDAAKLCCCREGRLLQNLCIYNSPKPNQQQLAQCLAGAAAAGSDQPLSVMMGPCDSLRQKLDKRTDLLAVRNVTRASMHEQRNEWMRGRLKPTKVSASPARQSTLSQKVRAARATNYQVDGTVVPRAIEKPKRSESACNIAHTVNESAQRAAREHNRTPELHDDPLVARRCRRIDAVELLLGLSGWRLLVVLALGRVTLDACNKTNKRIAIASFASARSSWAA
jgi:hypothetical protein